MHKLTQRHPNLSLNSSSRSLLYYCPCVTAFLSSSFAVITALAVSYAPKKIAPPKAIDVIRGTAPANKACGPSSFSIACKQLTMPEYCPGLWVISLVFTTSSGVVRPAAMPPAAEPHRDPCQGASLPPFALAHLSSKYHEK